MEEKLLKTMEEIRDILKENSEWSRKTVMESRDNAKKSSRYFLLLFAVIFFLLVIWTLFQH